MRVLVVDSDGETFTLRDPRGGTLVVKGGDVVDLAMFDASNEVRVVVAHYDNCEATISGETFKDAPIVMQGPRPHAPRRPKFDRALAREHARRFR